MTSLRTSWEVQARLQLPPEKPPIHPESGTARLLYDCPELVITPKGLRCRVVIATHSAGAAKSRVGSTREGVVYELFFTVLPPGAFTTADVLALYLHRGAFETVRASEDVEQDPDRWCSQTPWGQEFWQVIRECGVESAPGTGSSASSGSPAHHRICRSPHT